VFVCCVVPARENKEQRTKGGGQHRQESREPWRRNTNIRSKGRETQRTPIPGQRCFCVVSPRLGKPKGKGQRAAGKTTKKNREMQHNISAKRAV
jgi:hypothetical protein